MRASSTTSYSGGLGQLEDGLLGVLGEDLLDTQPCQLDQREDADQEDDVTGHTHPTHHGGSAVVDEREGTSLVVAFTNGLVQLSDTQRQQRG